VTCTFLIRSGSCAGAPADHPGTAIAATSTSHLAMAIEGSNAIA
jgi:hypothetical protein